ncbi:MAG: DegT/DnrJ/EryC1/StrS family aminotransferase [Rhodospirillales bacterium]
MDDQRPVSKVRYSYLPQQFGDADELWEELKRFVPTGDFTLGRPLEEFERRFAALIGTKHAIGVGSGTDAIKLSLKALDVGPGDEVITAANTFIATVGAICELGATPVFVDCDDTFCLVPEQVEGAITDRTKALLPVHFTGYMTDMRKLMPIAEAHGLPVVEDACQSILADIEGKRAGTWGVTGAFSLHPLKNINVWGDGGIITTDDDAVADVLRLIRNHGMVDRDTIAVMGYNSRLDTFQAVVGNWLIGSAEEIAAKRIENAERYDAGFADIAEIRIPPRAPDMRRVYHLYIVFAEDRDGLLKHCLEAGIEAKVHYPIPLYQQEGLKFLGYEAGAFPVTDRHTQQIITFPADQHLSTAEIDYVVETVREYYR